MEAPSVTKRLLVTALALAMLMLSGTMAWAVAEDLNGSDIVPAGVRIVTPRGQTLEVAGMTRDALRSYIQTNVADPVLRPVTVRYQKRAFILDPRQRGLVRVNVDAMLAEAFRLRESTAFAARVMQSITGATQTIDVKPQYSVDMTRTRVWVGTLAKRIDRKPVDATRKVVGNRLYIKASVPGVQTNRQSAASEIRRTLLKSQSSPKTVYLPVTALKPKVSETSFGRTIVVDQSQRTLYLYRSAAIEKKYRIAVGMPGFPTPLGQFKIVQKRYRPTWSNPGSGWAKSMPAYIPPGPGNPLGTRALNLDASGIRIHGTNKINSIGTAASHGCMRMLRHDVEELYDLVSVGTPVYIVP